jgi:hypothetical protein
VSFEYTYEVINVNVEAKTMEVVYTSEGRQPMHVGTRLPYEGENIEAVIQMYAPVAYWREQQTKTVVPEVGTKGVITDEELARPIAPTFEEQATAAANAEMWKELMFQQDVAKALVKFGLLQENPTVIPFTGQ